MNEGPSLMKPTDTGLVERLLICSERAGGKKSMATMCEISEAQLFRYMKGLAILPVDRLLGIAKAANVHPYWLLSGEGAPDVPPIESLLSTDQRLSIDAKSLTESLSIAEQINREYEFRLTPQRKADFIFALYQGMAYEAKLYAKPITFEPSKALEVYGYIDSIQGELPRKMILNTADILTKASKGLLPEKEIRTFCNYLNSAVRDYYNHPTLAQPYFDRIGYTLEPDTVAYVDALTREVKERHMFREEPIQMLDLGCGNGRHLLHFAKDPRLKVVGMDTNNLSKNICQAYEAAGKIAPNSFVEGDMYKLPFKDNSFEFVFINAGIFHAPLIANSAHGLNHVMQEIRRVLRPKGLVYIHSRYGTGFEPFPFFQLHNEGSIRQVCQYNGFQMQWFKKFFWQDSIEYIPKVRFNEWFSTLLVKGA